MATPGAPTIPPIHPAAAPSQALLEPGDRLQRSEFERRYERMPQAALQRGLDSTDHRAFLAG